MVKNGMLCFQVQDATISLHTSIYDCERDIRIEKGDESYRSAFTLPSGGTRGDPRREVTQGHDVTNDTHWNNDNRSDLDKGFR